MNSHKSLDLGRESLRDFIADIPWIIDVFTDRSKWPKVTAETLIFISKRNNIPLEKLCEIAGMQGIIIVDKDQFTLDEINKKSWKKGITRFLTWALYYEQKEEISYVNAHEFWRLWSAIGIAWEIYVHELVALYPDILPDWYSLKSADSEHDSHGIDMMLIWKDSEEICIQFTTLACKVTENPSQHDIDSRKILWEKIIRFKQSESCHAFMVFAGPCWINRGFLYDSIDDPTRHHLAIFRYGNHGDWNKIREQLRKYLTLAFREIIRWENFHSEDKSFGVMLHQKYRERFSAGSALLIEQSNTRVSHLL